jgi:hypothetical protein
VLSVDVYNPDTFKKYSEQVNNAKQVSFFPSDSL